MNRAMPLLVALVCGCATTVTERYPFTAQPDAVRAALMETASGLGWASRASADGKLTLIDPHAPAVRLQAGFAPEGLTLTGPARAGRLTPAGPYLAAATREAIEGSGAPQLTPRSAPLALTLDLILPAIGSLYARDFDHEMFPEESPRMTLATRLLLDGVGVELLVLSALRHDGPTPATVFLLEGITALVLNRVFAMVMDLQSIGVRNTAVELGVRVPTIDAVEREAKAAIVER